jgi:hypothetical protein
MTFSRACLCFCSVNIVLVVVAVVMMERDVSFFWQGRYEILSLSGSYLLQDTGGGGRQRTGGLSVSLAGTDGRVIGGGVAGLLVAASPIQVVVGTFISDPGKTLSKPRIEQEKFIGLSPASATGAATTSVTPRPSKLSIPGLFCC